VSKLTLVLVIAVLTTAWGLFGCAPQPAAPTETATKAPAAAKSTAAPAATAAAPSWQDRWETMKAAAKKEGKVTLYGVTGTEMRNVLSSVKDKFGFEVDYLPGTGMELLTRMKAEQQAGLAIPDLLLVGPGPLISSYKQAGMLGNMRDMLVLPEVLDTNIWMGNKLPFMDKDQTVVGYIAGYGARITVNNDMVKDGEFNSYRDLLNPKWKDKIVMIDPTITTSGTQWATFLLMKAYGWDAGVQFLKEFAAQNPLLTADKRLSAEWVVRGKYPVGVALNREEVSGFLAMGAPIRWLRVSEGSDVAPGGGGMSVGKNAPHPNATAVFVNWFLSKEGQTAVSKSFGSPSARTDAPTEGLDPSMFIRPGEKYATADEEFYMAMPKVVATVKEIFAQKK